MKILVIGGSGQVGRALIASAPAAIAFLAPSQAECDLTRPVTIARALEQRPDLVVNAAAFTSVDAAEDNPAAAFAVNRDGPATLARLCRSRAIPLLHLSTDYVFDGTKQGPYTEVDTPRPLNVYGRSKLEGEDAVRAAQPHHVILRTSWIFAPHGDNFVRAILARAIRGEALRVVADQRGCPTPASAIADAILTIARRIGAGGAVPWGVYHFAGREAVSWFEFAGAILDAARPGVPEVTVTAIASADRPARARRPRNSILGCGLIARTFGISAEPWANDLAAAVAGLLPMVQRREAGAPGPPLEAPGRIGRGGLTSGRRRPTDQS